MDPLQQVVSRQVIERVFKAYDPSLTILDFHVQGGTAVGDNYMSAMYAVTVTTKKADQQSDGIHKEEHSLMLKTIPLHPARQEMVNRSQSFAKESVVYSKIIPEFIALQKKAGLELKGQMFTGFPECYASYVDGSSDFVALKN